MYERFTDRARKVMKLANQEAQRFNHEYIGTEHLLLGLAAEGSGVAANVLSRLNLDVPIIRREVERLLQTGPDPVARNRKLPPTPRTEKVLEYTMEEARRLNHNYVGTEHILLGLLREREGVAAFVLMSQGLRLEQVREEVLDALGRGSAAKPSREEMDDLPPALHAIAAELDFEISGLKSDKEQAIADQDYEGAAALRDRGEKVRQCKQALLRDWIINRSVEPSWLSWSGGAVLKMAQRIHERRQWDALPELADALEQAGCANVEILGHCRQRTTHANQCWVVDLLLANRFF